MNWWLKKIITIPSATMELCFFSVLWSMLVHSLGMASLWNRVGNTCSLAIMMNTFNLWVGLGSSGYIASEPRESEEVVMAEWVVMAKWYCCGYGENLTARGSDKRLPKQPVFCVCGVGFWSWGRDSLVGLVVTVVLIMSIVQAAEK